MTTLEVRASILRDIASLLNNDSAMLQLQTFVRSLKRKTNSEAKVSAHNAAREALKEDLKEALQELKDARAGKIKLRSMEDLYRELETV